MHYSADTEPGSSGSPVFNDQWEVIALHHASVRAPEHTEFGGVLNEGIRVSAIVRAGQGQSVVRRAADAGRLDPASAHAGAQTLPGVRSAHRLRVADLDQDPADAGPHAAAGRGRAAPFRATARGAAGAGGAGGAGESRVGRPGLRHPPRLRRGVPGYPVAAADAESRRRSGVTAAAISPFQRRDAPAPQTGNVRRGQYRRRQGRPAPPRPATSGYWTRASRPASRPARRCTATTISTAGIWFAGSTRRGVRSRRPRSTTRSISPIARRSIMNSMRAGRFGWASRTMCCTTP